MPRKEARGAIVALFLFLCAVIPGLPSSARAADISRVLRTINFEERRLGNREELPMDWTKLEGEGLPRYVNGRLTDERAHGGKYSFQLELNGGSLIYQYDPRRLPVRQGAHYRVESFVQTTVLEHARARMTAYFIDLDGHRLPQPAIHSELYAARAEGEDWHKFSIELTPGDKGAAYLAIELELLQASLYGSRTLGDRTLFDQDIHGSAWFDDLTISQVPEITLSTQRPGNIFRRSDPSRVNVQISDQFTDDLAAQLVIKDAMLKTIYQRSGALDLSTARLIGPDKREASLELPNLPTGWYQARLIMTSRDQFVSDQEINLVRLADDETSGRPDSRFGVIADELPYGGWAQLPELMPIMSVGRVKISVWSKNIDVDKTDSPAFDNLLQTLEEEGIKPTACLTAVPPSIAAKIGGDTWARMAQVSPDLWRGDLSYLVARHSSRLDRWQFGADQDAVLFAQQPEMRRVYDLLYREFATLVDKPDLAMPWPAWYDLSGKLPATVALAVPPEVLPSQLPLYIQDLRGHKGHNLSLTLQLLEEQYGREAQIRDLAQRVIYALAAGVQRIDFPFPFVARQDGDHIRDEPLETFLQIRTLARLLSGADFRGKIPLTNGIDAFLFDRDGIGVVALWSRANDSGLCDLALTLAGNARRIDLWGNVTPLIQGQMGKSDSVKLDVSSMPIFLVGVDVFTAEFRSSVACDQPLLESSFEPHNRHIRFVNPGHGTVAGSMRLTAPPGWTLTPSFFTFSLNPGETLDRQISIEFPYNSFAGPKIVTAEFLVQSDRNWGFTVPITLNLGLSDVGMQTKALRDRGDLIIQQTISNYGSKPIDYAAFVSYPNQTRQERLVTQLGPGQTVMKLYRFNNLQWVPNAKVRSGLREVNGTRILNDEVPVE